MINFHPVRQLSVYRISFGYGCFSIINRCIKQMWFATRQYGIIEHTTRPTSLPVVVGRWRQSYFILFPIIKILAGNMPPMKSAPVGAIRIFLEKQMVFSILKHQSMRFICPVATRHTMKNRAKYIIFKTGFRNGQIGFMFRSFIPRFAN